MHIFFSGIGGTGIGPLAIIAKQAGYEVSGSDKQSSKYTEYLKSKGLENVHIGQTKEAIEQVHEKNSIDLLVHSSAVSIENPNHPELVFARENGIKTAKRDELLNKIIENSGQKLIAVAGTHGKTTTTAMVIWLFKQLGIPVSYSVGAKIPFGEMGEFDRESQYFVYEADEFDRNFLQFKPFASIISGIDYDHPDIYPTRENYYQAFKDFVSASGRVFAYDDDLKRLGLARGAQEGPAEDIKLLGMVNRKNATLAVETVSELTTQPYEKLVQIINQFPGLSRRFEKISENIYSDYAHTPEKIRGALQIAAEVTKEDVVVIYEGLHNTRQHFIKNELAELFAGVKKVYVVPSYLAREDKSLELLTPDKLCQLMQKPKDREPAELNEKLRETIANHDQNGDLVLCLSAGGGGSLDEWLRQNFS